MKRFQGSRFDESSRRRLIENQETVHELTARIQELQNEVNCLNDSREIMMLNQYAVDYPHVPSQPDLFPPYRDPGGLVSRNDKPPDFGIRTVYRETFLQIHRRLLHHFIQEDSNPWISHVSEHTSLHVMSESQTPNTASDPRCQSGPSAEIHSNPSEGRFFK